MLRLAALAIVLFLAACSWRPALDDAKLSDRALDLEVFFAGKTRAYGQFNDVFGTVRRRFEVAITCTWCWRDDEEGGGDGDGGGAPTAPGTAWTRFA